MFYFVIYIKKCFEIVIEPFENIHGVMKCLSFDGNKRSPNNGQDRDVEPSDTED